MARTETINLKRRKLLRKNIPRIENTITLLLLITLILIGSWFVLQQNNYDPDRRDLPIELLSNSSSPILYTPPIKIWTDPSQSADPGPTKVQLKPFPDSIVALGWQASGRVKEFVEDNLFEKINGEAEKFIKQGFRKLYYLVIKSPDNQDELSIELYDQGDISGSMGIFASHLSAKRTIQQSGKVIYFNTAAGVIGRKGKFFFRVAGNSSSDQINQKASQLVQAFAELTETTAETPLALKILAEQLKIPEKSITHQRNNVFQFDFARDFWFGRPKENAPTRLFLHVGTSPGVVKKMFDQIVEEQSYDFKVVEKTSDHIIMWHEFLKTYFAIGRYNHSIYGLENVRQKPTMAVQLSVLKEALVGGQEKVPTR